MKIGELLNKGLLELFENNSKAILIGEDVIDPYGGAFKISKGLSTKFPDRVISAPISESGFMGISVGLSLKGFYPVVEIMFGDFVTLASDQIINCISKYPFISSGQAKLNLLVRVPMGGHRGYGATHSQSIEKIFFGIPEIDIYAVSKFNNPENLLRNICKSQRPSILVENKLLYGQELYKHLETSYLEYSYDEEAMVARIASAKPNECQVSFICYGEISSILVELIEDLLIENEIYTQVFIFHRIQPLDLSSIISKLKSTNLIFTAEEGVGNFGWGSEVLSLLSTEYPELNSMSKAKIGAKNMPIPSSIILENIVLPSKESILKEIIKFF